MAYERVKNARGTALPWIGTNYPDLLKGLNSKPKQQQTINDKDNNNNVKNKDIMDQYDSECFFISHIDSISMKSPEVPVQGGKPTRPLSLREYMMALPYQGGPSV